jgi:DNA-binding transcriptional LysR family regulator
VQDRVVIGVELRHLRYFLAVAEERHFTRAADRLHVSQPPLSAQIRQLEQRLGATLFVRSSGPVALTCAGEALLEPAYAALAAVDAGVEAVRAVASGEGRVRVVVSATVPLGPALRAVGAVSQHTRSELARADDPEDLLRRGRADVAFLRTPLRERVPVHAVVATEPRSVLVAPGHRLTRCDELRLADLAHEQVLEPPDGVLGVGRSVGLEELLARVAAGDAVAVVPEGVVREHGAGLADVALTDAPVSRVVVVAREPLPAAAAVYLEAVDASRLRLAA